ncbi:hypothetical protein [Vibrio mediterranei]|uniref:Uncharacterized protein n=1 Tax=Vibrio mediterranei TaxID=689 RepID=A0AAN1FHZ3_9VIBR|nr:hypothetical protein [Vibrio mediterranei]ASI90971.1 hypothetical protein BSZ05_14865 [Vibrio mediterranei]
MERLITDPIHLPCPDMAGCVNPDPNLTKNSLDMVAKLKAKFAPSFPKKRKTTIPSRFNQACSRDEVKALGHDVEGSEA